MGHDCSIFSSLTSVRSKIQVRRVADALIGGAGVFTAWYTTFTCPDQCMSSVTL